MTIHFLWLRWFSPEQILSARQQVDISYLHISEKSLLSSLRAAKYYLNTLHSGECGELVHWEPEWRFGPDAAERAHVQDWCCGNSLEVQLTRFQNSACRVRSVLGGSVRLDRRKTVWWWLKIYMLFLILAAASLVLKQQQLVWWSGKKKTPKNRFVLLLLFYAKGLTGLSCALWD